PGVDGAPPLSTDPAPNGSPAPPLDDGAPSAFALHAAARIGAQPVAKIATPRERSRESAPMRRGNARRGPCARVALQRNRETRARAKRVVVFAVVAQSAMGARPPSTPLSLRRARAEARRAAPPRARAPPARQGQRPDARRRRRGLLRLVRHRAARR